MQSVPGAPPSKSKVKVALDSNVLLSALNARDAKNAQAEALVALLMDGRFDVIAPVLVLWEWEAYFRHPEKQKFHDGSKTVALKVRAIDVTHGLFTRTYSDPMTCIKGADRVFVSLAKDHAAPLITEDKQILSNAEKFGVVAVTISAFLSAYQANPGDA